MMIPLDNPENETRFI